MSGKAEIQEIAGIINLIFTEISTTIKFLHLHLHRESFMKIIDQISSGEFQVFEDANREILIKAIKVSRWLFWGLLFSSVSDITVHVLVVPGVNKFESLPLKMDLVFFDVNEEPYFKYVCFYQIMYKPILLLTYVIHQTLPWAVMCFTISQLDILINNFENMKEIVQTTKTEWQCDENEAFKEVFKVCVLHHSSIMRFVKTLQATFGGQFTTTLFLNACIVCTTAVQIFSMEAPLKNLTVILWVLPYFCIFICILFLDCYFGNLITVKSVHVASAAFTYSWFNASNKVQKNILLFMTMTQQPVIISAARLVPISLDTFTKVMNWTYKGFAVMNQMKK